MKFLFILQFHLLKYFPRWQTVPEKNESYHFSQDYIFPGYVNLLKVRS